MHRQTPARAAVSVSASCRCTDKHQLVRLYHKITHPCSHTHCAHFEFVQLSGFNADVQHNLVPVLQASELGCFLVHRMSIEDIVVTLGGRACPDVTMGETVHGAVTGKHTRKRTHRQSWSGIEVNSSKLVQLPWHTCPDLVKLG